VFYVASRGHHADIGGSRPGSMPPDSRTIFEEGASFKSFKIVSKGKLMEDDLRRELAKPGEHPGCAGTRNIVDNLADLNAQIAANRKGIFLVNELIDFYGLDVVQAYMAHIQRNAELAVKVRLDCLD
jgi:5-oxoprolinase (ATP-hydrolysing)